VDLIRKKLCLFGAIEDDPTNATRAVKGKVLDELLLGKNDSLEVQELYDFEKFLVEVEAPIAEAKPQTQKRTGSSMFGTEMNAPKRQQQGLSSDTLLEIFGFENIFESLQATSSSSSSPSSPRRACASKPFKKPRALSKKHFQSAACLRKVQDTST